MIQLANEPTAGRTSYRPAQNVGKEASFEPRRGRLGHEWPFLSRAIRPSQQPVQKTAGAESGS